MVFTQGILITLLAAYAILRTSTIFGGAKTSWKFSEGPIMIWTVHHASFQSIYSLPIQRDKCIKLHLQFFRLTLFPLPPHGSLYSLVRFFWFFFIYFWGSLSDA